MKTLRAALLLLPSMLSQPTQALLITESTDMPNAFPGNSGVLDIGVNTISGQISAFCGGTGSCDNNPDPSDAFQLTVTAGTQLSAISLSGVNIAPFQPDGLVFSATAFGIGSVELANGALYNFPIPGGPRGPGNYDFNFRRNGFAPPTGASGQITANWTWTLIVESSLPTTPVPTPNPSWLLLAGLPLLAPRHRH